MCLNHSLKWTLLATLLHVKFHTEEAVVLINSAFNQLSVSLYTVVVECLIWLNIKCILCYISLYLLFV